jgi:hypothetical protein
MGAGTNDLMVDWRLMLVTALADVVLESFDQDPDSDGLPGTLIGFE